jgi:hypothetical protein
VDGLGLVTGVAAGGDFAYLASGDRTLRVVDTHAPGGALVVATALVPGNAVRLAADGAVLAVTRADGRLRFFDIATPGVARPATPETDYRTAGRVVLRGGYAYFAHEASLSAVDVRTPLVPRLAGTVPLAGDATDVALAEDRLVIRGDDGLTVAVLDDPANPRLRGGLSIGGYRPEDVKLAAAGNLAFAGKTLHGCLLVTPDPVVTCEPGRPCPPTPIAVAPPQRTCPPDVGEVQVIDVGTPDAPRLRGKLRLEPNVGSLWAQGDLVLVGDWQLDFSDPDRPALGGVDYLVPDPYYHPRLMDLAPAGDLLHAATGHDGYFLFRRLAPGQPTATPTPTLQRLTRPHRICLPYAGGRP